jgi:hypothetical protein
MTTAGLREVRDVEVDSETSLLDDPLPGMSLLAIALNLSR